MQMIILESDSYCGEQIGYLLGFAVNSNELQEKM
jgi:hypothetical protein